MFAHELAAAGLRGRETEAAYAACGRYLRRRNSAAFPVVRFLLPPGKRPYYDAVLAFRGYADAVLDTRAHSLHERAERFDALRHEALRRLDRGAAATAGTGAGPVTAEAVLICRALAHTVRTWDMDPEGIRRFLRTLRSDQDTCAYATFEDLELHLRSVSGDMSIEVNTLLEPVDDEATVKAVALGYGVSMLEFLDDIAEDAALGRVYLPLADLERHGLSRDDLATAAARQQMTPPLKEAVRFEADRVRRFFRLADGWHRHVHPSGQELPRQCLELGRTVLSELIRDDYDIFRRRRSTRLLSAARAGGTTACSYLRTLRHRRVHPHRIPRTPAQRTGGNGRRA
ncbi:squalene/phytoene synthase family protein [Streptomyces sp. WMMC500]|uniref:squalene/phytoene synthase family protein n=1 Tax=Streptomyces sp. WMMC500 TaxID=3015154 RepID=UPI00248C865D|nr:squalene/phytoene synthase family protein [Streptomyces sp. WMMC500]WBB60954.1 squalene/phytoene synthase family protein [Streptomyces sp. WMMC500]